MLVLQNIEGDSYNPILKNYLVVKVINYDETALNDLQRLLELVNKSHEDLLMVECDERLKSLGNEGIY